LIQKFLHFVLKVAAHDRDILYKQLNLNPRETEASESTVYLNTIPPALSYSREQGAEKYSFSYANKIGDGGVCCESTRTLFKDIYY
jgi:hypothetical protein